MKQPTFELSPRQLGSFLANPRPIVVALYFKAQDVPKLWDLAARHYTEGGRASGLAEAAKATARGMPVVAELTTKEQIEEMKSFLIANGIEPPQVEELRV